MKNWEKPFRELTENLKKKIEGKCIFVWKTLVLYNGFAKRVDEEPKTLTEEDIITLVKRPISYIVRDKPKWNFNEAEVINDPLAQKVDFYPVGGYVYVSKGKGGIVRLGITYEEK